MFEQLDQAPPDPILGLTEAFRNDSNANKINLSVGVYKDADGNTPIFDSVKEAEQRILAQESTKGYLPIDGGADYAQSVQALLFGADHEIVAGGRAVTAHTPGGTGALRVAGEFIRSMFPHARIWMSDPTWPNHPNIFQASGMSVDTYPYFDKASNSLDFKAMITALKAIGPGEFVLLHGCCHNPTGIDPSPEQWAQIADVAAERKWIPLLDFAYQGLADGLEEDGRGLATLARPGAELLVASSFSKNFGLYNERVGALTLVGGTSDAAKAALSHIKARVRANYSNPPAHGAAIVTTILNNATLRAQWETEVAAMRERINGMRDLFVRTLKAKGVERDFSFLKDQRGMFSFSGLTKDQVEALRQDNSIYIVGSGRINVAGMTEHNMDMLCEAIAAVL
jgi:aspartate aminotransferase